MGKSTGAKFLSFLQMLILAGGEGVSRDGIIRALFADGELANITNSLNNLIYQSRRQLAKSGLPEGTGIRKAKSRYFWTSPVPTKTDIEQFTDALQKAEDDAGLSRAIALYRGDLLPAAAGNLPIDAARADLRRKYKDAVAKLASAYISRADSDALIRLYLSAGETTVSEDGDLEAALILALIAIGDSRNALKYYDRALRRCQSQERGRIPARLEACASRLSAAGIPNEAADMKTQLLNVMAVSEAGTPAEQQGAFYCSYPSFIDGVRMRRRGLSRDPQPVTLMLLTLVDYEGKPLRTKKKQERYAGGLREAIHETLRVGDSFTDSDPAGFLILLPGADEENAVSICSRIARRFKEKAGSNAAVRYRMLSLNSFEEDRAPSA